MQTNRSANRFGIRMCFCRERAVEMEHSRFAAIITAGGKAKSELYNRAGLLSWQHIWISLWRLWTDICLLLIRRYGVCAAA